MSPLVNVEAEAELLGSLMAGHASTDQIADLVSPTDFSEGLHARMFEAIVHQASKGKPVSPVAIKGFVEGDETLAQLGGPAYLARLTGAAIGLSCAESAKLVSELALRRRMADGLRHAAASCEDLNLTPAEITAEADAAISAKGNDLVHQPTGAECMDELFASYLDQNRGVTCGKITALDDLLGPMKPKQLVIGAGRPGMGKTALALSYALGAAERGHGVLYVSLEMSSAELAARMAADLCFGRSECDPVPYPAIRDGDLQYKQRQALNGARDFLETLPFAVVDAGNLTVGRLNMLIRRHARRMAAKGHKLELVIVDYLQLLSPDTKGRSNYEAVSEVSRALKAMAKDNGVAVFALAQLSRTVETRPDKTPQLSDLRDSGQIEQDADAVLFLLRKEYYLRQTEPEVGSVERFDWEAALAAVEGQIEFIVAKRRNGVIGKARGSFHGFYQAVRDASPEDIAA